MSIIQIIGGIAEPANSRAKQEGAPSFQKYFGGWR